MKAALFVFLLCLGAIRCSTSPTGRSQLRLLPDSQMREMGAAAFSDMKQKIPTSKDQSLNEYIHCVSAEITKHVNSKEKWETVVFEDPEPNAFALPGGKIGIHTGMLKVAKTTGQLAAVLGHEVAHVNAGHINERVSEELLLQGGLSLASVILADKSSTKYQLTMAALGLGAQFGIALPHSRRQEREADVVGLTYMAKAGFDPNESIKLWENMQKLGGGQPPEFLSTHPSHGTRIDELKEHLPEALALYKKTKVNSACQARLDKA